MIATLSMMAATNTTVTTTMMPAAAMATLGMPARMAVGFNRQRRNKSQKQDYHRRG